jgi:hypothetical protein
MGCQGGYDIDLCWFESEDLLMENSYQYREQWSRTDLRQPLSCDAYVELNRLGFKKNTFMDYHS